MSSSDHNHWNQDLAAYILGALEPGEAAEFERHLEGCERCRVEMRWFEPALATLPESVARQEPPRRLRESLMAEVRADAGAQARPAKERPRRFSRDLLLRPAMGLAVVVLVVAAVAGYEIGRGGGKGGGSSTIVSRQADGITVKMVREGKTGKLQLANVKQLPPQEVLEAWVRREGRVEAVPALFVPDREGRASTQIDDMTGVDTVMVTAEPQGGSDEPTTPPIVTMLVPQ